MNLFGSYDYYILIDNLHAGGGGGSNLGNLSPSTLATISKCGESHLTSRCSESQTNDIWFLQNQHRRQLREVTPVICDTLLYNMYL